MKKLSRKKTFNFNRITKISFFPVPLELNYTGKMRLSENENKKVLIKYETLQGKTKSAHPEVRRRIPLPRGSQNSKRAPKR